jgi:hypothetical protein
MMDLAVYNDTDNRTNAEKFFSLFVMEINQHVNLPMIV